MSSFTAIDLFSGIGGGKMGLQQAGFNVTYSNDNDLYCRKTFETNFNHGLDHRDITLIPSKEIPNHDLLAAGFPCQPFSMAGNQKGFKDPRGVLFFEVARIIKAKQPKVFLLENVKNLKSHNKGETLKTILTILEKDLGYNVHYSVLNSKDFGLPQSRARIYIVGFKDNVEFEFPEKIQIKQPKISDILEKKVDEFYYLSQKYYEGLANHKARHSAKGSGFGFEILNPNGISHSLVVGNMGRERNLIKDRLSKNAYSEGMDKAKTKNALGVRKLTIRECARLQGFPDSFLFPVSRTQTYKQLGNTVSIPVIKAVAIQIRKSLDKLKSKNKSLIDNPKLGETISLRAFVDL